MPSILEYKCPNCQGRIVFDPNAQQLQCEHCGTQFALDDLKAYNEALILPYEENMQWQGTDGNVYAEKESSHLSVYTCQSCGGETIQEETNIASSCPFCGNPVINTGKVSGSLRPDLIIPFKYDKLQAKEALRKRASVSGLVPEVFRREDHLDEVRGVYVPFWLYDTNASAAVRYRGVQSETKEQGSEKITEKKHFLLVREGELTFEGVPVHASTKMDDVLMESIEPYDLSEAVEFNTGYLSGYLANRYDIDASQCEERANERIRNSTTEAFEKTAEDYEDVEAESSAIFLERSRVRYALLPVWLLLTDWKGEKHLFAMNGQTGKVVGELPLDEGAYRKKLISLGIIIGAVIYLIMWLLSR